MAEAQEAMAEAREIVRLQAKADRLQAALESEVARAVLEAAELSRSVSARSTRLGDKVEQQVEVLGARVKVEVAELPRRQFT
jgi:hypothetical protein